MSESTQVETKCPVFEVHRVGELAQAQMEALSVADISRTYTELVPIKSAEQLRRAHAVAVVPPEEHMIVDRSKFKEMVAKSAREVGAKMSESAVQSMERTKEALVRHAASEMEAVMTLLATVVQTEKEALKTQGEAEWEATKDEAAEERNSRRKLFLDSALERQQALLQRLFDLVIAKRSSMQQFELDPAGSESTNDES